MSLDLKSLCKEVVSVAHEAGAFIKEHYSRVSSTDIITKSTNSFVSYVDTGAEKILVSGLSKLIPESGFITEEETIKQETGTYTWIIDPLDGTTNFLHKIPFFAVSIALQYEQQTILGVVLEVMSDEAFYAYKNGGAYVNDTSIKVSSAPALSETLCATGFPYYDYTNMASYMNTLAALMESTRGIRRCGAAALDLVYVAAGRFDAFFEYGLNPWDVAAGAFIVQEGGGKVVDFDGGADFVFGRSIIATSDLIHDPFTKLIQQHFKAPSV